MNRNNNLDKFEKLLNSRLLDQAPADDGWNIPSDNIFEQALPYFQKEKKKRRGFFFWFGIGVLLIGLGVLISYLKLNNNLKKIDQKIDHMIIHDSENNPDLSTDAPCPDDIILDSKNKTTSEVSQNKNTLLRNKNTDNEHRAGHKEALFKEKAATVFENEIDKTSYNFYRVSDANKTREQTTKLPEQHQKQDTFQDKNNGKTVQRIPLPKKTLSLKKHVLETSLTEPVPSETKQIKRKHKFKLGILYVPAFNATKLSGLNEDYKVLIENNNFTYANGLGIQLNYQLFGNIHLNTGLFYHDIYIRSKNALEINYDSTVGLNKISMEMKSPMGDATGSVTFKHDGPDPVPEGEMINSETELKHRICTFEIPLNIEYALKLSPKITLNFMVGSSFNKAIQDHVELSAILTHHDEVMEQEDSSLDDHTSFRKSFWNYNVGIGGYYNLSKRYALYFSGNYRQSFKPIVAENNVETSLQSINLKTGLFYNF